MHRRFGRIAGSPGRGNAGRVSLTFLISGLLVLALGLVVLETIRRHALYWYEVDQDYVYRFHEEPGRLLAVDVSQAGFTFPSTEVPWDTAVIELEISSTPGGYWFEPCIDIAVDAQIGKQCFERGAEGTRYLLLSGERLQPGSVVVLRGRYVRWQSQSAELRLFDNDGAQRDPVLVLAPHPDDAEIAAFGLYSSRPSFVVTMTAGNYVDGLYSGLQVSESAQDTLRGDVRTWDSLVIPLWGGVSTERTVNLGYLTYSLKELHDSAARAAEQGRADGEMIGRYRQGAVQTLLAGRGTEGDWRSVVADVATVVTTVRPRVIVAPHPMLDAHTDHQYTTIALLQALSEIDDNRATLLLYTNHHPQSESYPYGPSDADVTLPPSFDGTMPVAGIYSFTLGPDVQLRKLFALEAMHDLRMAPLRLTGGPMTVLADRTRQAFELIRRDPFGDYSYYRRAVRPNEIFLAYAPEDRPALQAYLEQHFPAR